MIAAMVGTSSAARCASAGAVLHDFSNQPADGDEPVSGLLRDRTGALYGTTMHGGAYGNGTAYKLNPPVFPGSQWTFSLLHSFQRGTADGWSPRAALIADEAGNLFGTTVDGGICPANPSGCGTVFELHAPQAGQAGWVEEILIAFQGGTDGLSPGCRLLLGPKGVLFGTTTYGGSDNTGVVFELLPPVAGQSGWTEQIIYQFASFSSTGGAPKAGLVSDAAGNLYGTTSYNGAVEGGATIFRLSPAAAERKEWTFEILHSMSYLEGTDPEAELIFDPANALYGTAHGGGLYDDGTAFKLSPPTAGQTAWTETVLHNFDNKAYGGAPAGALLRDSAGALYGTSELGGAAAAGRDL